MKLDYNARVRRKGKNPTTAPCATGTSPAATGASSSGPPSFYETEHGGRSLQRVSQTEDKGALLGLILYAYFVLNGDC